MKTKFKKGYYKAISFAIALLMILLSLPTSYVYANEGETNDQMLSEKAQSESGELSTPIDPDEPLPDGEDDKDGENEAKGSVLPPDLEEPTYLEDGVYTIKNVGNSTMYLSASGATTPNVTLRQNAYTASPTSSFETAALFKIKRISGTRYIVRLMTNNCLTFGVSESNIVSKELPYSNSSVASSDYITISETSTSGVFTISPYGSTKYLSTQTTQSSGLSILAVDPSSSTSRAHWTFTKYTGAHRTDMKVRGTTPLTVGNSYTLRPAFYSTKIDYNIPILEVQLSDTSVYTMTGPNESGVYTFKAHKGYENVPIEFYVSSGGAQDYAGYEMWDFELYISEGVYFFGNVELDETYMQIDDNESANQNGAQMELHEFSGGSRQKWAIIHVSDLYYKIISMASSKALTSPSSVNDSVTQTAYTGANNQLWKFNKISSSGIYEITSKSNSKYLAAGAGMFTAIGRNVEIRNAQSDSKDEWKLVKYSSSIQLEAQQQSQWCWVASARMAASNYVTSSISQASAAVYVKLGIVTSSPTATQIQQANEPGTVAEREEAVEYILGASVVYSKWEQIYDESTLQSLLDQSNPVSISRGVYNNSGERTSGHATIIYGYHWDSSNNLYVYDIYDPSPINVGSSYSRSYQNICDGTIVAHPNDILNNGIWDGVVVYEFGPYKNTIDNPFA